METASDPTPKDPLIEFRMSDLTELGRLLKLIESVKDLFDRAVKVGDKESLKACGPLIGLVANDIGTFYATLDQRRRKIMQEVLEHGSELHPVPPDSEDEPPA